MRIAAWLGAFSLIYFSLLMSSQAQSSSGSNEQQLLVSVNRARQARGISALHWNSALSSAARRHAAVMARERRVEHAFAGEPSLAGRVTQVGLHFSWLSENVAQGPSASTIQGAFLNSPNHRANILDPEMDSIGIGVVARGGQLYAVEDFSKIK